MEIKRSKYDVIVQGVCITLLCGITLFLIINWADLPSRVPAHYNGLGQIDRWASKKELWFLVILGWILYIGITTLERYPKFWNTGVTVTEENKERVYRTLKDMIGTVKMIVTAVFTLITINSVMLTEIPIWFLPIFLVLIFGSIITYLIKLLKIK